MSSPTVQGPVRFVDNDKAGRALYALLDLSMALSSVVDLDQLMAVIVEKASAVVEAERTSVFIGDAAVDSDIAREVARSRKVANIDNTLCAPILDSKGKLLGVIEAINKITAPRFDARDETLINAVAAHVAVAIERAQKTEVELENERFEQSLRVANEIQMRMLPSGDVVLPDASLFALNAHLRPAKHVGGDLYDFFWTNDRLHFCIGDVTGKGIGAALVMAVTKTLFRAHASFEDDPAKLMSAVNARLYEDTDPAIFVTAFCGILDLRTGRLRYSNAGHDRPLVITPGKPVQRLETKSGLPLGVLPKFNYASEEITLATGDALFLYTDGVTEATNRTEEMFTLQRLCAVLDARRSESPSQLVATVRENVDRFSDGTVQADDITMLCIQFRGAVARFRRDLTELDRIFEFIGRFANDRSVDFAVEEIFTNCVQHNREGKGEIEIRVARDGDDVAIAISDPDAEPFDIEVDPNVRATLEQRVPGGLGLFLTKKMMDHVDYTHENGVGTVTLRKRVG